MPGLIINDGDRLNVGQPKVLEDLDRLPMPAYELLPLDKYYSPNTSLRTISFIASRGCPYNCVYCSRLQKKAFRCLSVSKTIDQLETLVREHRVQWVEFVDEIFTLQRQRVIELCHAILQRGLDFQWGCGTRADKLDEDLIKSMKEAGCRKIGFGFETGVERVRYVVKKKITNEQIIDSVRLCQKHGLRVGGSFIFGHPGETVAEMKSTIAFAKKLRLNSPSFNKMIPIPNSELFELAKEEGSVDKDVWSSFMLGRVSYPLYRPKGVSDQTIDRIYRRAWLEVYLWPPNLWRNRDVFFNRNYFSRSASAFLKYLTKERYSAP